MSQSSEIWSRRRRRKHEEIPRAGSAPSGQPSLKGQDDEGRTGGGGRCKVSLCRGGQVVGRLKEKGQKGTKKSFPRFSRLDRRNHVKWEENGGGGHLSVHYPKSKERREKDKGRERERERERERLQS
jgi:hypothetical protein